ncbi:MAG: hypothetical protein ACOY9Y_01275 [Bacillota bacterium]
MTRKNTKGIIGKTLPTANSRPEIGPGIGFKEINPATGPRIEERAREKNLNFQRNKRDRNK